MLLTGHRDGRVRLWDMACEVPRLLGTAPHDLGGPGSRLQPVSVIKVNSLAHPRMARGDGTRLL